MTSVVVTGGLGFIGSNFLHHIIESQDNVQITNIDYEGVGSNPANATDLPKSSYRFVKGDIADEKLVSKILKDADWIVNFAAETHVDRSIANPEIFFHSNTNGPFNLFEIARKTRVKKIVHVSTDEVYGSTKSGSFDENSPLNPSSPYSSTKAAADLMARAWHATYELPIVVVRC